MKAAAPRMKLKIQYFNAGLLRTIIEAFFLKLSNFLTYLLIMIRTSTANALNQKSAARYQL